MAKKAAPLIPLTSNQAPPALPDTDTTLALCADADSFMELYRTYLPLVYRYLLARLHDQHEAEDLTALVFERM
jgi:DNA-directed RNA polymerase specialized sigma24 family protein